MYKASGLCMLVFVMVVGCSPQTERAALPPLTLVPPPTPILAGDCSVNSDLANWLEFSTFYVTEFVEAVTGAAAKNTVEMYEDVILMGQMRADFSSVAAPDCAEEAHRRIVDAMTHAVAGFQAFINQDADSLGTTVADVLSLFDQIVVVQNDLMARLEIQLGSR